MIDSYTQELKSVRAAIERLTADPTASTSVSSANGGSFSASYIDLDKLYRRETELCSRIAALYRQMSGGGGIGLSYSIYCGG